MEIALSPPCNLCIIPLSVEQVFSFQNSPKLSPAFSGPHAVVLACSITVVIVASSPSTWLLCLYMCVHVCVWFVLFRCCDQSWNLNMYMPGKYSATELHPYSDSGVLPLETGMPTVGHQNLLRAGNLSLVENTKEEENCVGMASALAKSLLEPYHAYSNGTI